MLGIFGNALTILMIAGVPQQPSGEVSPIERQTLIEFFAATGGTRWINHKGWGTLPRFSRELKNLGVARFEPKYDYPFSGVTDGGYLTTKAATWGDKSRTSVETYNRQGPREVWVAQQLFLGLLVDAFWVRESRRTKCDFEK
jgi:hypothetical protein